MISARRRRMWRMEKTANYIRNASFSESCSHLLGSARNSNLHLKTALQEARFMLLRREKLWLLPTWRAAQNSVNVSLDSTRSAGMWACKFVACHLLNNTRPRIVQVHGRCKSSLNYRLIAPFRSILSSHDFIPKTICVACAPQLLVALNSARRVFTSAPSHLSACNRALGIR